MRCVQVLLSPSKGLNFEGCATAERAGRYEAAGVAQTAKLVEVLQSKSAAELAKVLDVSTAIATETYERYRDWAEAEPLQAIAAYDGFAYAKLDGRSLSEDEMRRSHETLVIPSGLWGPLRGLDVIKPYRLEMACKKLPKPYDRLADSWKDLTTRTILDGFVAKEAEGGRVLVNVASDEYAAAVDFPRLRAEGVRVVKCDFYQAGRRAPTVHLKYGRGLVARYVIQHVDDDLDALKAFNLENYAFDPDRSSENTFVFARDEPPPPPQKTMGGKPSSKKKRKR
mmetsp:Transcript_4339/g.14401  ORF Transcript_4339/g.14401 Transcript_4339/m.14401 type:complete len:282 (-) Transcript_4339:305-1150(-)